jgi:homoserine dehydrogenase
MPEKLNIGLFGFGCVGQGLHHVLNNSKGFKANIARIAVKNRDKPRSVSPDLITFNKWEILDDPDINVVVELIDDAEEAWHIVSEAMRRGKHVVTANKKLVALHLEELYLLQKEYGVSLLYEGAVCGSIPIIRSLEEYFDNEALEKITGIFNGTTNYILSKTLRENLSYSAALAEAQQKGFAETDPSSDVEGFDPKYKAVILALHGFGLIVKPEAVVNIGISHLHASDIQYAAEKGYHIKLTPLIQRLGKNEVSILVAPQFVKEESHLFKVENEFNGVVVQGQFSGEQFLQGRGAGSYPTGAAVLSDISALSYGYKYEYKKYLQGTPTQLSNKVLLQVYFRYKALPDLGHLEFEEVQEQYTSSDYSYVVGKINLQTLLNARDYIAENGLFIALVNDHLEKPIDHLHTEFQTLAHSF